MKFVTICTALLVVGTSGLVQASGNHPIPNPGFDMPSSISIVSQSRGFTKYLIKGIYGTYIDWTSLNRNCGREIGPFTTSDSLQIVHTKGICYLTTDRAPADLPDFFNSVAKYSGVFPTWEELVVRGQRSKSYGSTSYQLLCHYKTHGQKAGYLQVGYNEELPGKLELTYLPNPMPSRPDTFVLTVSWDHDIGPVIDLTKVGGREGIELENIRLPKVAKVVFRNGENGESRLNATTSHCMFEMNHCLRVFDSSGEYVWEAQEEFPGQCGVWAVDFNGNGDEELVVASQEHGSLNVFVYGKPVLGN